MQNRMWQIKPDATEAEINAVLLSKSLDLGHKYYIYLDRNRQFKLTTTPPAWVDVNDKTQLRADGKNHPFVSKPIPLVGTLVNTYGDFNIHECPFLECKDPALFGVFTATFIPSSGANNLLGELKFTETAAGLAVFSNAN